MKKFVTRALILNSSKEALTLTHRATGEGFYKDKLYTLPGGRGEDGESPEECLLREVEEEVGLKVTGFIKLGAETHVATGREIHVFLVTSYEGEPVLKEPDVFENLSWMNEVEHVSSGRSGQPKMEWAIDLAWILYLYQNENRATRRRAIAKCVNRQ